MSQDSRRLILHFYCVICDICGSSLRFLCPSIQYPKPMADTPPGETLVIDPADLAPGDMRSATFDFSPLTIHLISSADDPMLEPSYRRLWDEFSHHHSMEQKGVIIARLAWDPTKPVDRCSFLYRMIAICKDG